MQWGAPEKPATRLSHVQAAFRDRLLQKLNDGRYQLEALLECPCGSTDADRVTTADRFGIPVGVVLCTSCGLLRTSPRLAARNLPAFYDEDYHGLHMGIEHPDPTTSLFRQGQGAAVYAFVRPYLSRKAIRVAEVGAGTGSVLREFSDACRADGIDTTLAGCEYAADFVAVGKAQGIDMRQGGVSALADIEPPDVLILSHVVEHFADLSAELKVVRELVGEATLVYVEVPGVLAIHKRPLYELSLRQYLTLAHMFHFTMNTLREAMAREGFRLKAGNEDVHSVFVRGDDVAVLPDRPARVDEIRGYLHWLETSPSLHFRRAMFRSRRAVFRGGRDVIRRVAGERGVRAARSLLRRPPVARR